MSDETSPRESATTSRRRNLLREFYGIQQPAAVEKEVIDTANINSQHFDATKYYEDLLKSNNLASLIQIDNNMIAGWSRSLTLNIIIHLRPTSKITICRNQEIGQ